MSNPTSTPPALDLKLEVIILPVADTDRAKRFYEGLGWRVDGDFVAGDDWRGVQMTPPGSPCSIQFGKGITTAAPGSLQGTYLVVADIEAARAELVGRGVEVSEIFHLEGFGPKGRVAGIDPTHRSYSSQATFTDPDGNGWRLQEVTTRLPGRGFGLEVATVTELLRDAEAQHGRFEPTAPKHHWSDFYAGYVVARAQGQTPEDAARAGAQRVESARHVAVQV